ncbi:putative protein phosphatase 2C 55 [Porphyridium purpureum]|uniref:Protein phosphatase n=1 Tax=Porphyridium purpureum TaxID=35688 RepID=A0A5J4YRF7_PORPP|nr:putative protein phosphatase 2C 55 [Porphyridium purpureum]|eukprot:POR0406..scf222_8
MGEVGLVVCGCGTMAVAFSAASASVSASSSARWAAVVARAPSRCMAGAAFGRGSPQRTASMSLHRRLYDQLVLLRHVRVVEYGHARARSSGASLIRYCASESVPAGADTTRAAARSSELQANDGTVSGEAEAAGDNAAAEKASVPLRLHSASACIPHPDKAETGGEDAHFVTSWALSVFDGVGGWQSVGVDSGEYSRTLSSHVERNILRYGPEHVVRALEEANIETERSTIGSTTALCVALCTDTSVLYGCNVGDSGLVVFRDNEVVFRTKEQQHYFNCPYQIGTESMDTPTKSGQHFTCILRPNDMLVLGTDGLFDNVTSSAILKEIQRVDPRSHAEPKLVADAIAQLAFDTSCDTKILTPFGHSAALNGYRYIGGKQDDITVIFSRVLPHSQEGREAEMEDSSTSSTGVEDSSTSSTGVEDSSTSSKGVEDETDDSQLSMLQRQITRVRRSIFRRRNP